MGAGLAGALALGYWLGAHRDERQSASTDNGPTAAAPITSAGSDSALQPNPAAAKVVEQARAEHFTKFHSVQDVLALPSAFARREALYTIAGRADPRDCGTPSRITSADGGRTGHRSSISFGSRSHRPVSL